MKPSDAFVWGDRDRDVRGKYINFLLWFHFDEEQKIATQKIVWYLSLRNILKFLYSKYKNFKMKFKMRVYIIYKNKNEKRFAGGFFFRFPFFLVIITSSQKR